MLQKEKKLVSEGKPRAVAKWAFPPAHRLWEKSRFIRYAGNARFVEDEDYPDFCVFLPPSLERKDPWHYLGYKLFISGENVPLDDESYDWGESFGKRSPRNLRILPGMVLHPDIIAAVMGTPCDGEKENRLSASHPQHALKQKTKFCIFFQFNNYCASRNRLFELLSRRARVDAIGHMFRTGPTVSPPRYAETPMWLAAPFYRPYKFVIAFENSFGYGYTTEKLWLGLYARAVPIYWGNPRVGDLFNPERFINAHDFDSLESLARHVLRVHADDELYLRYLSAPIMTERQRERFFADKRRTTEFRDNLFGHIHKYPTSLTQRRVFQRETLSRLSGDTVRTLLQTHRQHTFRARNFEASSAHIWPHRAFYEAMDMPHDALPEG